MYNKVCETTSFIKDKIQTQPQIAIILGSGLGELADCVENKYEIDYASIPHFPVSTVAGHSGKLIFGQINGVEVVLMQGRFHFYEGYDMKQVTYPIFVFKQMGIEKLIVTNACGGVNPDFEPGNLMLINDYINMLGTNPLMGKNDERFGVRFPDMSEPYSIRMMNIAKEIAKEIGVDYKEGVYMATTGPCYETSAEIRAYRTLGTDAVGMSTVPETQVANYLGMEVLGIACITNMATGIQTMKHSHARVVEVANAAGENLCKWVQAIIKKI